MDRIRVKGFVTIHETIYDHPVPIELLGRKVGEGENHITNIGFAAMMALLAGAAGTCVVGGTSYTSGTLNNLYAASIKVGTVSSPTAAADGDTALSGSVAQTLSLVTTYALGSASFAGVLSPTDLENLTITEEGLFTADGKLLAHVTTSPFPYSKSNIGVQITHTFTLTRE